ncbi:adenylate/guanylate cyclase domain-containing protein [Streptomyces sp. CA-111067]|uniref:adenylate/guanylate cyclase domain-containing protein n=1 Tax=Streptomyces sp. CA-111067 TaxID=3240046 RepID=UPI003D967038
MTSMLSCRRCSAVVPAQARFCPSCGTETAQPAAAPPEARKLVTVVFCDLTGSTELSGRLDPEALRAVTLRYFAVMRECLERHGGTVEKFIGDAVMAVFGVPVLHEDDAQRAVRAAMDMLTALEVLNEELERDHGVRLNVRIGINTGEVVATGDPFAQQVLVSGEVVNVAARLEQNAQPGQILIGPDTFRAVDRLVVAEVVGPLRLKGKADTVLGRRLLDLRGDDPAVLRRFDSPFVGRGNELREVRLIAERAVRGRQCHLLTLFGDAGIGKTRLARHWLAQASAEGMLIGTGRCRPYGEGGSLLALADAVRPLADEVARAMDASGDQDPDAEEAFAVLRGGLLLDGAPSPSVEDTCWAVTWLIEAAGRERPVVLVLDDCHWASAVLFDVVDHIVAEVRDTPVVVLCTARPELLDRRPGWGGGVLNASSLIVPRLEADEVRLLAAHLNRPAEVVAHAADGPDTLLEADALLERAEGNPLYLEQLLATVGDSGDATGLPPTMHALIAARIEALEPGQRATLDVAAVAGQDFTLDEVTAVLGEPPAPAPGNSVDPVVHSLVRRRLVEPSRSSARRRGAPYRFASALIREVAYIGMAKRTRAERHERLADHLAARGADDETVGTHLERAFRHRAELGAPDAKADELRRRTAHHLGAAGQTAADRCDLLRAADLLHRATTLLGPTAPASLPLSQRLAEALFALGRPTEARDLLTRVEEAATAAASAQTADEHEQMTAPPPGAAAGRQPGPNAPPTRPRASLPTAAPDPTRPPGAEPTAPGTLGAGAPGARADQGAYSRPSEAARIAAHAHLYLACTDPAGDFPRSVAVAHEVEGVFAACGDGLGLARVTLRVGQQEQVLGRYAASRALLEEALGLAEGVGAAAECATAMGALAVALWLGPTPAGEAVARCQGLLDEHADRRAVRAAVSYPLAVLHALRGEPEQARACLDFAEPIMRELGLGYARAFSPLFAGTVDVLAGRPDDAEERLRESRAAADRLGDTGLAATAARNLARLLLTRGRHAEAADLADGTSAEDASPVDAAETYGVRARVLAARGEGEQGLLLADRALAAASRADCPAGLATAHLDRAHVLAALHRTPDAATAARAARAEFLRKDHRIGRSWADAFLDGLE